MNLKALEAYIAAHVAQAEDSVKAEFTNFFNFVTSEEAKVTAEIENLAGLGYTVTPPAPAAAPAA